MALALDSMSQTRVHPYHAVGDLAKAERTGSEKGIINGSGSSKEATQASELACQFMAGPFVEICKICKKHKNKHKLIAPEGSEDEEARQKRKEQRASKKQKAAEEEAARKKAAEEEKARRHEEHEKEMRRREKHEAMLRQQEEELAKKKQELEEAKKERERAAAERAAEEQAAKEQKEREQEAERLAAEKEAEEKEATEQAPKDDTYALPNVSMDRPSSYNSNFALSSTPSTQPEMQPQKSEPLPIAEMQRSQSPDLTRSPTCLGPGRLVNPTPLRTLTESQTTRPSPPPQPRQSRPLPPARPRQNRPLPPARTKQNIGQPQNPQSPPSPDNTQTPAPINRPDKAQTVPPPRPAPKPRPSLPEQSPAPPDSQQQSDDCVLSSNDPSSPTLPDSRGPSLVKMLSNPPLSQIINTLSISSPKRRVSLTKVAPVGSTSPATEAKNRLPTSLNDFFSKYPYFKPKDGNFKRRWKKFTGQQPKDGNLKHTRKKFTGQRAQLRGMVHLKELKLQDKGNTLLNKDDIEQAHKDCRNYLANMMHAKDVEKFAENEHMLLQEVKKHPRLMDEVLFQIIKEFEEINDYTKFMALWFSLKSCLSLSSPSKDLADLLPNYLDKACNRDFVALKEQKRNGRAIIAGCAKECQEHIRRHQKNMIQVQESKTDGPNSNPSEKVPDDMMPGLEIRPSGSFNTVNDRSNHLLKFLEENGVLALCTRSESGDILFLNGKRIGI
eukprot:g11012.t1